MGSKNKIKNRKPVTGKVSRSIDKGCSRCERTPEDGEAFRCYQNRYKFNIDIARQLVADGREAIEMDVEDIDYSLERAEINEGHLPHVDPSIPGIVSYVFFPTDEGVVRASRLIDGHHRAARCRQLGIPFRIYVLSERESVAILERGPEGSKPEEYSCV